MALAQAEILEAVNRSGLSGRAICLHSSLRSFGLVEGGADAVIGAFLSAGCTLIVPTFFYDSQAAPPPGWWIPQNGLDPKWVAGRKDPIAYDPDANQITREEMGAIPARLLERPGRVRGNHPSDPFAGLGPRAAELITAQSPLNIFGPYKEIYAGSDAWLVLAGVGLTAATPIHFAEELSGRRLFRRWGMRKDGTLCATEEGGCSEGFENLAPAVASLENRIAVGAGLWRIYPFRKFIDALVPVLRANPSITHCGDPGCLRCNDAVKGGPRV
ncbi:MAG: AAC(3) family N-acetyltransferase [Anaerolineales bacterium]|nr:AAC(3) family N-acetyltransferase [Anaerolineales bacterium]